MHNRSYVKRYFIPLIYVILTCRSEFDGDLQSQLLSKANEEDKNCSRALSVVSAVVYAAKDLLHRALAVDGKNCFFFKLAILIKVKLKCKMQIIFNRKQVIYNIVTMPTVEGTM